MTDRPTNMQQDLRLSEERTELALERTREAAERTLMAWIRTSLAMIGFGFGTFKLFELLLRDTRGDHHDPEPHVHIAAHDGDAQCLRRRAPLPAGPDGGDELDGSGDPRVLR